MNYYHEWWETARNQKPLILTKPKERELLLKRIKALEEGMDGKAYVELEAEKDNWKDKANQWHREVKDVDNLNADLAEESFQQKEQITKLEQEITNRATELADTETYYRKELKDREKKYKVRENEAKNLSKNKTDNENLLREAKKINEALAKERDDYKVIGERLAKSITSFLTKQGVSSIAELQAKIQGQENSLSRLVKDNGEKQQWIQQQKNKLLAAYPLFGTIKDLVEQSKTVDLFKKNQKQLLERITNFEKVWEWETKKEILKESKPTLTDTIRETITGKKKAPKTTAQETQWRNIDLNFTTELIKQWENKGFTFDQTREWINIGLSVNDADYCAWIRDIKKKDAEWVLNNADADQLNQEYETWKANQ